MATLKHVGRLLTNQKKCCVVYRVLPGDPNTALVVLTQSLDASEHDALISLVDSSTAQTSDELGEAMARTQLPDGRNMLAGFHKTGKFVKIATNLVEMTPNNTTTVQLDVLNNAIAEQKGVTVNDLAIKDGRGQTVPEVLDTPLDAKEVYTDTNNAVLSDDDLAKSYRSQADRLSKEAAELRRQAEELVPTKKKAVPKKTATSA